MLVTASLSAAAAPKPADGTFMPVPGAVVSGIVRDAQGVAQMGALVQILTSSSMTVGTAFTDLHGRFVVANLHPGRYHVRASAALFVPTLRENLQLRSGARTVVNLTLSTLFETTAWIPAERRKADEPGDDWKWTLRSGANRPILRMVDDDGQILLISSSATEGSRSSDSGKGAVVAGDGTFSRGGVHNVLAVDRSFVDGSDVRFRVDAGTGLAPGRGLMAGPPSTEVQAGYQRRLGQGGAARTVISYQSHPEMVSAGRTVGLEAMQIATAQKMQFGDMADIEVGSALNVVRTAGYLTTAHPFLRVTTHPTSDWAVGYRMATSRDMQAFNSLDAVQPELPVAVQSQGKLQTERGLHQEIFVTRKAGRGMIQASYYRDALDNILVSGTGALGVDDLGGAGTSTARVGGLIADSSTGAFRVLATGYRTQGVNVMITEPLTPGLWAAVEYENGSALAAESTGAMTLLSVNSSLHKVASKSATFALKGRVMHTGTNVRAAYRWQPTRLVSAVNPYGAFSDQAFFSFFLRQPVNCGRWLPAGLEATVDVTNLLAQGYRPFLSADGRTLYLAQAPRSIQGGLAFNF
ncbi:MAG: hypothetical protein JWM43_1290 [Acidobacteriaceae bacterium]|nr:hypothetical protein [Acidobacteriaceae bacterium]